MASAGLTRKELSLGSQDSNTGVYAASYSDVTIDGSIQPKGVEMRDLPVGFEAKYDLTLFTADTIYEGDEVLDGNGDYYVVKTVQPFWWLDQFSHFQCELVKRSPHALRPTSSGTWSGTEDARTGIKDWLNTYLTAGNLLEDDGVTHATYRVCFSGASYPITKVFLTKEVDLIFTIGYSTLPTSYTSEWEDVPIDVYAVDKSGLTADNLLWQAEAELRRIVDSNPQGVFRGLQRVEPEETASNLKHTRVMLSYWRNTSVTRRLLSLGSQDSTTGWYASSFATSTINMVIRRKGAVVVFHGVGAYARYNLTGFTSTEVAVGDEILDAGSVYYVVRSVEPERFLGSVSHYVCQLEQRTPYALGPTTSGTWHLDGDAAKTDPRYRHKVWLDTYLTAANMKLNDGSTNASVITCFHEAPYPLTQVLLTKDVDGVFSIDKANGEPLLNDKYFGFEPYAFIESVPIHCVAVDKADLTATNLLEQMEQEIRRVCTDYPLGSLRSIDRTDYKVTEVGGTKLWECTVTVRYKRANDDYGASYPRITWGTSGSPTGTYRFPNCVKLLERASNRDAWISVWGFNGTPSQAGGTEAMEWMLECDLDVDADYTWKRAQTGAKTDVDDWDVFRDIWHNAGIDEPYQTLTFSASGPSVNVKLVDYYTDNTSEGKRLYVTVREYLTSPATSTYTSRLGIS